MSNLGLFIRGFAMGVSDSVPGVSGGTIALMTGVYEKLILSLQAFDLAFFLLMLRGEFKTAWVKIDGGFLSMLGVGIIVGVISSANSILFILSNFSEPLMGFFIGLILYSAWFLLLTLLFRNKSVLERFDSWAAFSCGVGIIFLTRIGSSLSIEFEMINIFIGGFFAIGAMLLPGISGALVLLIFGIYEAVLSAVVEGDFSILFVFGLGCFLGLIVFARGIGLLLTFFLAQSYFAIIGMLVASCILLWPWQDLIIGYHGELLTPWDYTAVTGNDPHFWLTIFAFFVGVFFGLVLQKFSVENEQLVPQK